MTKPLMLAALFGATALSAPAHARPMTETDLATMKRLSAPAPSPDGSIIAYQLRETDLEANKGKTDLYMLKLGTNAQPVMFASKPDKNEHDPVFAPDGKGIYYLSNESGSDQIWRYDVASASAVQVSNFKTDVSGFKISPMHPPSHLVVAKKSAGAPIAAASLLHCAWPTPMRRNQPILMSMAHRSNPMKWSI